MSGYSIEIPTGGRAICSPGPVSSAAVSVSVGGGAFFFFLDWWVGAWRRRARSACEPGRRGRGREHGDQRRAAKQTPHGREV